MVTELATRDSGSLDVAAMDLSAIERVIVAGDLSKLTPDERWDYYKGVCQSVGLNPFTKPFEYITLNGKLTLYALKGATDQLRGRYGISIGKPAVDVSDGLCMVTVGATGRDGRTDSDLGIVPIENLRGDAKANAIMKAITKAKRRVTLSFCGLGMLDETEVETIPSALAANVETIPPDALPSSQAPVGEYPNLDAALEKARAADGAPPDVHTCFVCEAELHEVKFKDGSVWTTDDLANFGQQKHAQVLCMHHYREANQAKREAAEALQSVPF